MRAGRPWKATCSWAMRIQRAQRARRPGRARGRPRRCARCRPGRRTAPPSGTGPLPSQNSGRMNAGTKPGIVEGVGDAGRLRLGADVVAVVEGDGAGGLEREHGAHVVGHRGHRAALVVLRVGAPQLRGLGQREPGRDVAVRARRARRSGRSPRRSARRGAPARARPRRRCRPARSTRRRPAAAASRAQRQRLVEVGRDAVEVARLDAASHALGVDLDAERHAVVHRHRQRLRAAHAAQAGGEHDAPARACPRSAGAPARRTSRRCPAGCPGCRCRSTSRRSSGRTSSGRPARAPGTSPRSPSGPRGCCWR